MNTAALQEWVLRAAFCIVGVIHLLPLVGISGRKALETAYGVSIDSPDVQLLLQHRAVLFGLLGSACLIAVLNPAWRLAVWWAALMSTCSFMLQAWLAPSVNAAITRVVWADGVAVAALLIVLVAHLFSTR